MTDTKKIFSNTVMLSILLKMCFCLTVYDLNRTTSKSFDDGKYRPTEHNNDEAFYRFGYRVNAIETGDIKQHTETRVNNEVKGAYFLIEPNGVGRLVEYIANANGFNAVVRHQYAVKNSTTQSDPFRQTLHTNILNERKANNEEKLSQRKNVAFDRYLQEQNDKYQQQQQQPQNSTYRKSSPKSITNQSSIRLLANSSKKIGNLPNSAAQIITTTTARTTNKPAIGRRRQYEVIDPEVEIDIRRSVPKPFLNLEKLKQPRKQNNK